MENYFDLDNLEINQQTLYKISDYYYENMSFPIQIYIFLLNVLKNKLYVYNLPNGMIRKLLICGKIGGIIADSDSIEVLSYALDNNITTINDIFIDMCKYGKLQHVKYLNPLVSNQQIKNNALYIATCNGHIEVFHYLLSSNEYNKETLLEASDIAICNGYIEIIKELPININNNNALKNAATKGYLDIVKYLVNEGVKIDNEILQWAKQGNKKEIIRYLNLKINI